MSSLKDLRRKEEPKPVTVYNYQRDGETFTTPNAEIAIARRNPDIDIQAETHIGEEVQFSTLVIN